MNEIEKKSGNSIVPKSIRIKSPETRASEPRSIVGSPDKHEGRIEKPERRDGIPGCQMDGAQPLEPGSFPNSPNNGGVRIPATLPNLNHLLKAYEIKVRYNVIKKKLRIIVPGLFGSPDNADNSAMTQVISLAILNNISAGQVPSYVEAIGDRNQFNPVADWINSKPWDGIDRLQPFYDTLVEREGYPKKLKELLMRGIKTRLQLLLPIGLSKSVSWMEALKGISQDLRALLPVTETRSEGRTPGLIQSIRVVLSF